MLEEGANSGRLSATLVTGSHGYIRMWVECPVTFQARPPESAGAARGCRKKVRGWPVRRLPARAVAERAASRHSETEAASSFA